MSIALVRCADACRFALVPDSPLTDGERAMAARIGHARRRAEWVSGRVAAKWLFLTQSRGATDEARPAWPPQLHRLGIPELESMSSASCRRVEVSRGNDGDPRLLYDGAARREQVSIAHCGGWAVAALNHAGEVGIDLEEIAPRRAGFYESNMSDPERRWMASAPQAETDRVGTLLWVLKEACLKTGASVARTIWEIGAIDLDIATPASVIAATWPSSDGPDLITLPVRVPLERVSNSSVRAAYGAVGQLALGVVALTTSGGDHARATGWRARSDRRLQHSSDSISRGGLS